MGSYIELNDTFQLTTEQGFPKELVLDKHLKKPFKAEDFKEKVFFQGQTKHEIISSRTQQSFFST